MGEENRVAGDVYICSGGEEYRLPNATIDIATDITTPGQITKHNWPTSIEGTFTVFFPRMKRKRFCKLLMAMGWQRNEVAHFLTLLHRFIGPDVSYGRLFCDMVFMNMVELSKKRRLEASTELELLTDGE